MICLTIGFKKFHFYISFFILKFSFCTSFILWSLRFVSTMHGIEVHRVLKTKDLFMLCNMYVVLTYQSLLHSRQFYRVFLQCSLRIYLRIEPTRPISLSLQMRLGGAMDDFQRQLLWGFFFLQILMFPIVFHVVSLKNNSERTAQKSMVLS